MFPPCRCPKSYQLLKAGILQRIKILQLTVMQYGHCHIIQGCKVNRLTRSAVDFHLGHKLEGTHSPFPDKRQFQKRTHFIKGNMVIPGPFIEKKVSPVIRE